EEATSQPGASAPFALPLAKPGSPGYTVVTIVNPVEHPRDYVVWSIFSFFYGNTFCLGLAALIFSIKARDMKVTGDLQRARGYSKWALGLNVAALIIISKTIDTAIKKCFIAR
uniref:Uncharacterized protein n=1 Tax=Gadus morhua TaxID=8049 RepID=A0A8C5AUU1_GADMO